MYRRQFGAIVAFVVVVFAIQGAARYASAQIALPTIHVGGGQCSPNATQGFSPDPSKKYPQQYTDPTTNKPKTSLRDKPCTEGIPQTPPVKVTGKCVQVSADTGKCKCSTYDGKNCPETITKRSTQTGTGSEGKGTGSTGETNPTTPKPADTTSGAKQDGSTPQSSAEKGDGASPSGGGAPSGGGSGGGQQGGQQGGQSQPSQTASQLNQALNPTPISQQPTMKEPVKVDQLPKELYDPKPGTIADRPFETPAASAPQGTTPRPVQTIPFQGGGTVGGLQPPTGNFAGATTDRPPVYDSFNYDSTFGGGPQPTQQQASQQQQQTAGNPCDSVFSYPCISSVSGRAADAVGNVLKNLSFVQPSYSASFDRSALQNISDATRAACDVYGCSADASQLAKAIAGVCSQEAGGCDPDVVNKNKYGGLPQTDKKIGVPENMANFDALANNPYIAMSDESRAYWQQISDRAHALQAAKQDPRKDPAVGAAMIVMQQFSVKNTSGPLTGTAPALVAANVARGTDGVVDAKVAAAVMQTGQLCPACITRLSHDPNANITNDEAALLRHNSVSVKAGDPVTRSFEAMLASRTQAYAPKFQAGINAHTLATANPTPSFLEPQVAYTMGNVGKTQYPQALAYAPADRSAASLTGAPFPDSLTRSTFSPPVTSRSFAPQAGQGSGSGVGGSARTPSFFTQSFFSQPVQRPTVSMGYSNPSAGYTMPGSSGGGQFNPTLAPSQPSYAPYSGGPTPIFAQGSVPSQITGIGGSPSAPAFTQQSYYGQPTAAAPRPSYSFTDPVAYPYTMPSLAPVSVTPQSFAGASQINPLAD